MSAQDKNGVNDDADKGWVNEDQTWKDNTLYIDFYRPTSFTNSLKDSHIPNLDVKKKYDYTLTYGVYATSSSTQTVDVKGPITIMGTAAAPSSLTVLKGANYLAGVTAAAGLVAVTLF